MENLSSGETWLLRTAEGWIAERAADDPDKFFVERLEQDTCDFTVTGAGSERCVFVDTLRVGWPSSEREGYIAGRPRAPHGLCPEIIVGRKYAEVVVAPDSALGSDGGRKGRVFATTAVAASQGSGSPFRLLSTPCRGTDKGVQVPRVEREGRLDAGGVRLAPRQPPMRSLLAKSVEVGDADAVSIFVKLFVPAKRATVGIPEIEGWGWGVVVGDFDIYLSNQRRSTRSEKDNGGDNAAAIGEDAVSFGEGSALRHKNDTGEVEEDMGSMHVTIEGPGGLSHSLPVSAAFRGRWMTLKLVIRRSGESVLVCTPGEEGDETSAGPTTVGVGNVTRKFDKAESMSAKEFLPDGVLSLSAPVVGRSVQNQQQHQQRLGCVFSNPCFFRGDRVSCIGLYSTRPEFMSSDEDHLFPFRARHAVVFLGSVKELEPPPLSRLWSLERLVAQEEIRRRTEPPARPTLALARRLRRCWSGEVPVSSMPPATTFPSRETVFTAPAATVPLPTARPVSNPAGHAGSPSAFRSSRARERRSISTFSVWQPLLYPGRVIFGTAVSFSRKSSGNSARRKVKSEERFEDDGFEEVISEKAAFKTGGPTTRRCLAAWEHPALQTPARFKAVPLPPQLSEKAAEGKGLWAWAPVPRSEAFLAMGLVLTTGPEPPALADVRCVQRHLVKDAEPQKCKVIKCTSIFNGSKS